MTQVDAQSDGLRLGQMRLAVGLVAGVALYLVDRWNRVGGVPDELRDVLVNIWVFIPVVILGALGALKTRSLAVWALAATLIVAGLSVYQVWVEGGQEVYNRPSQGLEIFLAVGLFVAHGLINGANAAGRWRAPYGVYFDIAWKDAVRIILAIAFVGALWAVLFLGAALFNLIGVEALKDIITKPVFAYPATTTFFALAVHVTDVRAGLVRGARTLALTLLSWLLPLMTILAAGFLAALPFTGLEPLWETKSAAGILLGAAAALIILVNAAYQEGEQDGFPPRALKLSAKLAALTLTPILAIAGLGLFLRIGQYGFTPERIEGLAAVFLGAVYALGYGWASLKAQPWMKRLESTNVLAAHVALALIVAIFSPLADPARISVEDQMQRLRSGKVSVEDFDYTFLKFSAGRHGLQALNQLVDHPFGPQAADMAERARNAREAKDKWTQTTSSTTDQLKAVTVVGASTLPASFVDQAWPELEKPLRFCESAEPCAAIVRDFDSDGAPEILVVAKPSTNLFSKEGEKWILVGHLDRGCGELDPNQLRLGKFTLEAPKRTWPYLVIAGRRAKIIPDEPCSEDQAVIINEELN